MHGSGNDYVYVIADRVRPADPGGAVAARSPTAASASAATA